MEMKFDGEFAVNLPREEVFNILSDPEKFAPLLPSFDSLDIIDERSVLLRVKVGIGKIRGTATTELILEQTKSPQYACYSGKGKVMQGAYQLHAMFELEDRNDGGTKIKWQGETELAGKILSLVGGGLQGYAEKEIQRLINSLQEALSPESQLSTDETKAKSWLSRIFGGGQHAEKIIEPPTSGGFDETVTNREFASTPDELASLQADGISRINRVLAVKRKKQGLGRKEDERLIRGRGLFVDDFHSTDLAHMAVVRSPYAHAKILNIDVSRAESVAGVICTLTGKEIAETTNPFFQIGPEPSAQIKDYCLAVDKVRYQGDPVAVVIATSISVAQDAAQLVDVEYETLPVVVDVAEAMSDETLLHEQTGTNYTWQGVYEYGDVDAAFEEAAHVVKIPHLRFHRFSSTALEANGVVASWNKRGEIDLLANTIMTIPIAVISGVLNVSVDKIRLRTHDIGGSFGNKQGNYPYMTLATVASRKAGGIPVKWIETRSEHMQAGGHGGERNYYDTEVALDKEGVITAVRSLHVDDCGALPRYEPLGCVVWTQVLPGAYKFKNARIDFRQVMTNKGPCAPNRGYSRLPHVWFIERLMDICGHELGISGDEMRLRNFIQEFPYTTPNGCIYDSGDLPLMLSKAKEMIGWEAWKTRQKEAREAGRYIGIGIGTTLDSGTNSFSQARIINPDLPYSGNSQVATVKLDLDGTVSVAVGSFPQGQGHETVAAQVVAEELNIDADFVNVKTGFDSDRNVHTGTNGTYASQFAVTGLSAIHGATLRLMEQMKKLAAFMLEANVDDLEFGSGEEGPEVRVIGSNRSVNYWSLANLVNYNTVALPEELHELGLNVRHVYIAPFEEPDLKRKYGNLTLTYAIQMHIAVVEVKLDTGQSKVLDYAIVDDCGKVINHMIVEGQLHGAAAHGIGATLLEIMPYDESGNVLSGSFTDYAPITINNMPDLKCTHIESPSPFTYNGAKGMGEGGGAPMHAISAAIQDALFETGIIIENSHNSPMALFETINSHRQKSVIVESR